MTRALITVAAAALAAFFVVFMVRLFYITSGTWSSIESVLTGSHP